MLHANKYLLAGLVSFASLFSSVSRAEMMTCLVSVYTAQDVVDIDAGTDESNRTAKVIELPIVDGEADQEFQVNGETVAVTLWKYEHTDMYEMTTMLTTPVADRVPRGPAMVAMAHDRIYNDGPARGTADVKTPGTRFAYLQYRSGSFALATKLVAALKAEGLWGKYPFTSTQMEIQSSYDLSEFILAQVKAKKMQPTDVVGLATMLSCTYEK